MESMQVDSSNVGRIIGSRGSKIKEMQEISQARIQVSREEAVNGQTTVTITGSEDQIATAKQLIEQCTSGDNYGGGQRRRDYRDEGRDSWRNDRQNRSDDGRGWGSNSGGQRSAWGGGRNDDNDAWGGGRSDRRNDSWGGRGGNRDDSWGGGRSAGRDDRGGGFSRAPRENNFGSGGGSGGGSRDEIYVLSMEAGRLIGAGGSRIKELQTDSNCRIKMSRDSSNGVNLVELFGTPEDIEEAKVLISRAVDIVDQYGSKVGV